MPEIDLVNIFVEIIGTFFIISIILQSVNDHTIRPFAIGCTYVAAIYFGTITSVGGHFNPAVSFGYLLKNKMEFSLFIAYVLSQLIGCALAVKFNNLFVSKN